jgi:hypothetical protein
VYTPCMVNAANTAAAAAEYKSNIGHDYSLAFELAEFEAEQEAEDETPEPSMTLRKVVTFRHGRRVVKEFVGPYQI